MTMVLMFMAGLFAGGVLTFLFMLLFQAGKETGYSEREAELEPGELGEVGELAPAAAAATASKLLDQANRLLDQAWGRAFWFYLENDRRYDPVVDPAEAASYADDVVAQLLDYIDSFRDDIDELDCEDCPEREECQGETA